MMSKLEVAPLAILLCSLTACGFGSGEDPGIGTFETWDNLGPKLKQGLIQGVLETHEAHDAKTGPLEVVYPDGRSSPALTADERIRRIRSWFDKKLVRSEFIARFNEPRQSRGGALTLNKACIHEDKFNAGWSAFLGGWVLRAMLGDGAYPTDKAADQTGLREVGELFAREHGLAVRIRLGS